MEACYQEIGLFNPLIIILNKIYDWETHLISFAISGANRDGRNICGGDL